MRILARGNCWIRGPDLYRHPLNENKTPGTLGVLLCFADEGRSINGYVLRMKHRFHNAMVAVDASDAVAPCTRLHAG
jgi:hypothetical protein